MPPIKEGFGGLGYIEDTGNRGFRIDDDGDDDDETLFNKLFAKHSGAKLGIVDNEQEEAEKKKKNRIQMGGDNP